MTIQISLNSRSTSPGPRRRSRSVQPRRGRSMIRREDPRDRQLTPAPMKYTITPTPAGTAAAVAARGRRTRLHHRQVHPTMTTTTPAETTTIHTIETTSTAPSTVLGSEGFAATTPELSIRVVANVSPTSSSSSVSRLSMSPHQRERHPCHS